MPLRLAVVDIGSNTATLAVYRANADGGLDRVLQVGEALRLYRRMGPDRAFPEAALDRTVELMARFRDRAAAEGATLVQAVATSAVRDARNGEELCQRIRARTGVPIRILDGESEGVSAAVSAVNTLPFTDGVVVDMGGGSMQLARVTTRRVREVVSLPLGALRLTDEFFTADPPDAEMIGRLRRHLATLLGGVEWLAGVGGTLVGVGGSVRALAKWDRRRAGWPLRTGHGYRLGLGAVEECWERFSRMNGEARRLVPGLAEHRADTAPAAAFAWFQLLRLGGFDHARVSTYGVREGVAWRLLLGEEADLRVADVRLAGLSVRFPPRRPPEAALAALRPRLQEPELARHTGALLGATWLHASGWAPAEAATLLRETPLSGFYQEEVAALLDLLGQGDGRGLPGLVRLRLEGLLADVFRGAAAPQPPRP